MSLINYFDADFGFDGGLDYEDVAIVGIILFFIEWFGLCDEIAISIADI
jgi:hypothetical protein